jgi:hypothetical protein
MTSRTEQADEEPLLHSFFVAGQVIGDDCGDARIRKFVEQKIVARQEAHFAARRAELAIERERWWVRAATVELVIIIAGFVAWCFRG